MRARIPDRNIWLIYAAIFVLGLAYGDSIALTSLHLDARGFSKAQIGSATYYTTPLHLQPALRFLGYDAGSLPETERAAEVNFSIPLWPGMPVEAQERVVAVVRSAVGVVAPAA